MLRLFLLSFFIVGFNSLSFAQVTPDRVVLSSSGLGYFEYFANATDDRHLIFSTRETMVNDVLKSLLVSYRGDASYQVSLSGKDSLQQIFQDLPFSQKDTENPIALFNNYRGAYVELETSGRTYNGQLISITPEIYQADEITITRHRVSILTESGLRQFVYEDLSRINFTDQKIIAEINNAMTAVLQDRHKDNKDVRIQFNADVSDVRFSYIAQVPLWKASYRLVLPMNEEDGIARLQGHAIVENMTGQNWDNVEFALTSGVPVTLQQELYPAYYIDRPFVPIDAMGRILPRIDRGSIQPPLAQSVRVQEERMKMMRGGDAAGFAAPESMAAMADDTGTAAPAHAMSVQRPQAEAASQSAQVSFYFQERISLANAQSMMLPFVDEDFPVEMIALYQPDQHARHPFLTLRLNNANKTALPPGILTLYRQGETRGMEFVGDAQMDHVPEGQERMISYALDNGIIIDRDHKTDRYYSRFTASGGVIRAAVSMIDQTDYLIQAPTDRSAKIIIEHPRREDFELMEISIDEAIEQTQHYYRIPVNAAQNETIRKTVRLQRDMMETINISNMNADRIVAMVQGNDRIDRDTYDKIIQVAEYQRRITDLEQRVRAMAAEKQTIYQDQSRLRDNITVLSDNSDLKNRYLQSLETQETRLQEIMKAEDELRADITARQEALRDYIARLEF